MTSGDAFISIVEWRNDFVTEADDREFLISNLFFEDDLPPALGTKWTEIDES